MENFNNLVKVLIEKGYSVNVSNQDIYKFAAISGKGVRGGFATEHDENHLYANYYFNGIVTVDNEKCFDKPRKCPLHLKIPKNESEMNHLLKRLEFWGSKEGYEASNDYEFDESSLDL